jgi:WD repeat-containing protein 61
VLGVAFAADDSHIATCSSDHSVRTWSTAERQCLQTFADAHSDQAWGVAFDPSAGRFASVGDDKAVRVFEATTVRSGA